MKINDSIISRRSIRNFNNKQISDEIIKNILMAAIMAPSGKNGQPWKFFVINKNIKLNSVYARLTY